MIDKYAKIATERMEQAIPIDPTSGDPFKVQKDILQASKVQELSCEYSKVLAQLRCARLAHEAAAKAGFEE